MTTKTVYRVSNLAFTGSFKRLTDARASLKTDPRFKPYPGSEKSTITKITTITQQVK